MQPVSQRKRGYEGRGPLQTPHTKGKKGILLQCRLKIDGFRRSFPDGSGR